MWLDDEGEDPEGGTFPDPSTRQWRHPSEIAAENAKAAAEQAAAASMAAAGPTPVLASASSSASILWPITVVGGCIAVAALGVFGLYLTGASSNRDLIASAATTIGQTGRASVDALNDSSNPGTDSRRAESLGSDSEAVTGGGGAAPESSDESATTTTTSIATTTTVAATTTAPPLLRSPDPIEGPALYRSTNLKPGHIAAVAVVDQFFITSASAVQGHSKLSLRINGTWIDATIEHSDPFTDVAVVLPVIPVENLRTPVAEVGGPVSPGARVYLGYCATDSDPSAAAAIEPGCSPQPLDVEAGAQAGGGAADEPTPVEPDRLEEPDSGKVSPPWLPETRPPAPPEDPGAEEYSDRESNPKTPGTTIPKKEKDPREGTVYSMSQTLRSLSDHWIYNPIRTEIPRTNGVAGSPLRDADGKIIGLVIGSSSPNISALPIDRVIEVATSLVETGEASQAWIGITTEETEQGLVVISVDETSPAFESIEPGDILLTVNGQRLLESDHLVHALRNTGVGGDIELRVRRGNARSTVVLTVAIRPNR